MEKGDQPTPPAVIEQATLVRTAYFDTEQQYQDFAGKLGAYATGGNDEEN